jgi:hypothetical protein
LIAGLAKNGWNIYQNKKAEGSKTHSLLKLIPWGLIFRLPMVADFQWLIQLLSPCLHMGRPSKWKATEKIEKAGKEKLNLHFYIPCFFKCKFQNID